MHRDTLRWCNWAGLVFLVGWLFGFVFFAHVVPPPSPNETAEEIAQFYRNDTNWFRFGIMITLFVSPLYTLWAGAIATQLRRMSGVHPILADIQFVLGGLTVLVFMIPALFLEVAAYRTDRPAEITQALNDLPWMMFIGMGATAILQPGIIAVAILQDRSTSPVLPRWAGYFNVWTFILFLPGPLCVFFKTGPLAWDGVFPWWIPLVVFALWMVVMIVLVQQAINRSTEAESPVGRTTTESASIRSIVDAAVEARIAELGLDRARSVDHPD